jgi:hypothetical protein
MFLYAGSIVSDGLLINFTIERSLKRLSKSP